jgi:hypothetical protein
MPRSKRARIAIGVTAGGLLMAWIGAISRLAGLGMAGSFPSATAVSVCFCGSAQSWL